MDEVLACGESTWSKAGVVADSVEHKAHLIGKVWLSRMASRA